MQAVIVYFILSVPVLQSGPMPYQQCVEQGIKFLDLVNDKVQQDIHVSFVCKPLLPAKAPIPPKRPAPPAQTESNAQ